MSITTLFRIVRRVYRKFFLNWLIFSEDGQKQTDIFFLANKIRIDFNTVCEYNKTQYTVNHVKVETYLFHSRDRRRVQPGRTCDIQTLDAISRHASVE